MSAFRKRRSTALAAALGIAPGMSLSSLVFADAAPPATQSRPAASLHNGDLVRVRSGGPLMTVTAVQGDQVNCTWTDWDGRLQSENFPVDVLSVPVTVPSLDPWAGRTSHQAAVVISMIPAATMFHGIVSGFFW